MHNKIMFGDHLSMEINLKTARPCEAVSIRVVSLLVETIWVENPDIVIFPSKRKLIEESYGKFGGNLVPVVARKKRNPRGVEGHEAIYNVDWWAVANELPPNCGNGVHAAPEFLAVWEVEVADSDFQASSKSCRSTFPCSDKLIK
jgi:hypothetical protein